jgi:RHS repeat-associated protein
LLGEYGATLGDLKAEHIWLLPELFDRGLFGGGDGQGAGPVAVATPTATGGTQIAWVYGDHLGVPLLALDAGGNQLTLSGFAVQGFPGQRRALPDLYYNRYRDYDPTTGRYIQADPIGLAGRLYPHPIPAPLPFPLLAKPSAIPKSPADTAVCAIPARSRKALTSLARSLVTTTAPSLARDRAT